LKSEYRKHRVNIDKVVEMATEMYENTENAAGAEELSASSKQLAVQASATKEHLADLIEIANGEFAKNEYLQKSGLN
jgi:hypothetical protein